MSNPDLHDPLQGEIVHEYEGIVEADNVLPRWWLGIFFASIAFAAMYWFFYETWGIGTYPLAEYRAEMAAAAASGGAEVTDDLLEMLTADESVVGTGQRTFETNCAVCHGARGEGNIGPNLTDPQWIHGGAPTDIHRTIREGVGARGMPAWGPVLGEQSVQALAAYVLTLRDTSVPERAPEGEVWTPGAQPEDATPQPDAPAASDPSAELRGGDDARPEI
jgi:cytochrome c oxidase cbb3-type subunit 3